MAAERCTALHGVPTMFIAELDHPQFAQFDLSTLRTGIMAGAPCPIETMKRVVAQMNMREVMIAYGMTETSPVSFQSSTTDPLERRVSTVGRIQPHLRGQGRRCGSRHVVPVGQTGELWVRGYSVMQGYWGDDERTREAVVDGWMRTGDLATIDAEGYCNIVGRIKDMLIRGGENIYPREIEEFLFRHPKVQSVQVFGVPDPKYGEEVCAWIVLKPGAQATEDEIREFCRDQIAHYKVPRYIRFVDRDADDDHRQGAEVRDARADDRGARGSPKAAPRDEQQLHRWRAPMARAGRFPPVPIFRGEDLMKATLSALAAAVLALATAAGAQAQVSNDVVKVGLLVDMSGLYSDLSGPAR